MNKKTWKRITRPIIKRITALGMSLVLIGGNGMYCYAEEREGRTQEAEEAVCSAVAEGEDIIDESQLVQYLTNADDKPVPYTSDEAIEIAKGLSIPEASEYEIGEIQGIEGLASVPALLSDLPENTDPNNAYGVRPNTEYTGNITSAGEMRWYAFDIARKSKVSIFVMAGSSLDADVHMFKLEPDTMQLFGTGMNATAGGAGEQEYFSYVMDEGVYFFAIYGYSGTGAYIFDFFANADYVDEEVNDTIAAAQTAECNGSYEGLIDTTQDVDCYKVALAEPTYVQISFSSNMSYNLQWIRTSADEVILQYQNQIFKLGAGTHYFGVYSPQNEFSFSDKYIVTLKRVNADDLDDLAPKYAHDNWNYTLDDGNETITLNNYIGSETDVVVYGLYQIDDTIYRTKLASNDNEKSSGYMFAGNNRAKTIKFGKNIDTSETASMAYMFRGCSVMTDLDVSQLNTSNVTNMFRMFDDCIALKSLNLNGWDTRKVTNMKGMFERCISLASLQCYIDTCSVTDMRFMFSNCRSLVILNLGTFDTSKVRNMFGMFKDCHSLESVNVSSFDTRNVTEFGSMFEGCWSLGTLDISSFYLNSVPQDGDMCFMFTDCFELQIIYVNYAWEQRIWSTHMHVHNPSSVLDNCGAKYVVV